MTEQDIRSRIAAMTDRQLEAFLIQFAAEVTTAARDAYEVGGDGGDAPRLRAFNEALHRIIAAARHAHARDRSVAVDMVVGQVTPAADDPLAAAVASAFDRAVRLASPAPARAAS